MFLLVVLPAGPCNNNYILRKQYSNHMLGLFSSSADPYQGGQIKSARGVLGVASQLSAPIEDTWYVSGERN